MAKRGLMLFFGEKLVIIKEEKDAIVVKERRMIQ